MTLSLTNIARELLVLCDAEHGVLIQPYSVVDGRLPHRWFADGRGVGFLLASEDLLGSLDELAEKLKPVVEEWKRAPEHESPEGEYERLKRNASNAGFSWVEEQYRRA